MNINKLKSSSPYLNKIFEFIKTNVENTLRGKKLIPYSIQIKKLKVHIWKSIFHIFPSKQFKFVHSRKYEKAMCPFLLSDKTFEKYISKFNNYQRIPHKK